MKLKMLDRVMLPTLLPVNGDITLIKQVASLKTKVSFTHDEISVYKISRDMDGRVMWDSAADKTSYEAEFTASDIKIISEALKELNKKKALTVDHLDLYKLFVENKKQ